MPTGIQLAIGHDVCSTITHIYNSVVGIGAPSVFNAAASRNGAAGLRFQNSTNSVAAKTLPTPLTDIWVGFAYRLAALPAGSGAGLSGRGIFELRDAGTRQLQVRVMADGTIRIYRGGNSGSSAGATQIAVVPGFAMLPNVFYYFELYARIDSSSGLLKFRVNEIEKLDASDLNTQASANNHVTEICPAHSVDQVVINADFDDIVVRDDQFPGDRQVREDLPTGTGATDQWSAEGAGSTREAVDESPPDEDTSYAHTDTTGNISLWTYPEVPTTSNVDAMIAMPRAKKTDAGTAQIQSVVRTGGNNYNGESKAPSQEQYEYHPHIWMLNPDTSDPWTPSEINAAELGVERTA